MQKTHSTAAVSAFAVRNSLVSDPGVLCFLKYLWACVKKTSPYGKENTSETSQTQTLMQNSVVFLKHSYKKQMLGELDSYLSSTVDELQQGWLIILLPGVISSQLK